MVHSSHEIKSYRMIMSGCSSTCFNPGTDGQILMKFGVDVMPLPDPYFYIPTIGNSNMADARTCEVEATLAPL
jgi:hypothetical protein